MAIHAHSTTAPARRLLPLAVGRAAPVRDARGRFARRAELPPEPQPPSADEVLDDMARELDRQGVPRVASLAAPVVRLPLAGASSPSATCTAAPPLAHIPDPAFAAVRAFDRVVAEWDAAFGEYLGIMEALDPAGRRCWDDPAAVARAVLGPIAGSTVAALDRLLRRMGALDARHEAAEARLSSTRAASEIGTAALRAAVRRYARRPYGCRSDEALMLERLAA